MRFVIGYGNELRGEDGFGIEVVKQLEKHSLNDTKLISCFQLTPELCLKLLDAKKIIFVDAAYSSQFHYAMACSLEGEITSSLSHHIGFKTIVSILKDLYGKTPEYEVYSLLTDSFDNIEDKKLYTKQIEQTVKFLINA